MHHGQRALLAGRRIPVAAAHVSARVVIVMKTYWRVWRGVAGMGHDPSQGAGPVAEPLAAPAAEPWQRRCHEGSGDRSAGCGVARAGRADPARAARLDHRPHPGQPGHVDGGPDAAAGHARAPVAGHHAPAQDRRTRGGDRGRGYLLCSGHPGRRRAVRPHRAWRTAGPVQRSPAPVDARHGRARRGLYGAAGQAGHGTRRGPAVVRLQRLPEWRVRHPERGDPRPRAGTAARHGGRLGGHADRARPGPGHHPGRGCPQPEPGQRLHHARGADGGAGAAVRAVHPRPPRSRRRTGSRSPGAGWHPPTGSARAHIPISGGPG